MLGGRTGLCPVMVGRGMELARLQRALAAEQTQLVLVSGEAGVGKTRLLRELAATLPAGARLLAGQASQGVPARPFQLLLEAIGPSVSGWRQVPQRLADHQDPLQLLLRPLLPHLEPRTDREYSQEELLAAAVALVEDLLIGAGRGVLVFEDLHWADAQSVALFGRLALAPDLGALLVGSFRPEAVDRRHPLVGTLAEVGRQREITQVALDRLDQHAVAELLAAVYGHPVPFRVAEAMHRRTGGNPFFLEELLITAGDTDPEELQALPLPWNLSEAVLRRLDHLGPAQRRVVEAAAVLGERIPFDLLAAVTGSDENELIDTLRKLVSGGVVLEDEPDVFRFRHSLTREAIAGELLGRERRRLHEKALAALQEAGSSDWAAIAWHARGAGRYDELIAAARAGAKDYLRRGASLEALRLAEEGLSEAGDDRELETWASKAAWLVGLIDVAVEHGERWHALTRQAGDPEAEVGALVHLARLYYEAEDHERQWEAVWSCMRVAEPLGPGEPLARAYALVSEAYMLAERRREAVEWSDRALELAEQVGFRPARVTALVNKGSALIELPGGQQEGVELLEQAITEASEAGYDLLLHRALHNLLWCTLGVWPPQRSRQTLRALRELSERTGRGGALGKLHLLDLEIATVEGDLAAAQAALREERRLRLPGADHQLSLQFASWRARLALEAGDLAAAGAALADHDGAAPQVDLYVVTTAALLRAELAARRGDLEGARSLLDGLDMAVAAHAWCSHSLGMDGFTGALLAAIRAGLDRAWVRAFLARADSTVAGLAPTDAGEALGGGRPLRAARRQVEAALKEAEGDLEGAVDAYLEAGQPDGQPAVPLRADCQLGAARCLVALGRSELAKAHARAADQLLERWPGWRRDEVRSLLVRLRAVPRRAPGPLTPREREVAQLVAEGLSNGEVAKRLFISTKTASVHVSNILAKLGMSSRVEIAAWAVGTGLAGRR